MEYFHFIEEYDDFMGRKSRSIPAYLKHSSGQARIVWKNDEVLVGPYGSAISYARYQQILDLFEQTGKIRKDTEPITIAEIVSGFLKWADQEYHGSREPRQFRLAFREVVQLYGPLPAIEFRQSSLRKVRDCWVDRGLSVTTVNMYHSYVVRLFRWAVEREILEAECWRSLQSVQRLKKFKSQAKQPEKVYPIEWENVIKIKDKVSPQVWAMIELQWHSGMRPGEVAQIRPCDIDMSGDIWFYRPQDHKTKYRGHERVIGLGKACQSILLQWINRHPESYCFSPAEAEEHRRSSMTRKTKVQPSQVCRKKDEPKKKPGDRYTQQSYAKAIAMGCKHAGIARWGPNRIRHSFATRVRQQFGLDAAQAALGHKHAKITEVYAERTVGDIEKIAKELG